MAANTCQVLQVAVRTERCCITPLAYKKMSKAQREGYPEEGWTAYAVRKEKEMEELHTLVTVGHVDGLLSRFLISADF